MCIEYVSCERSGRWWAHGKCTLLLLVSPFLFQFYNIKQKRGLGSFRRINRQSRRFSYSEGYRRRFNSLLFRTCDVFRALINSLCCVFSQFFTFCRLLSIILFFVSSCKANVGPKQSERETGTRQRFLSACTVSMFQTRFVPDDRKQG